MDKLNILAKSEGVSVDELLKQATFGSECYGICMNPDCDATYSCEPDATQNWCEECGTNTVKSCLILAGLI